MADLHLLRRSLGAFADAIGKPLTDWQLDALRLEQRVSVIVAPRQSGKSRSLAVLGLWLAFRKKEQRVLVISAGEEASRRLLGEIRQIIRDSPLLHTSVVDEMSDLVTLDNGSEIRSVPASERQVRGWTVDALLCDECSLIADDLLLGAALPTTAARPDAKIVLASSATSASGAFYDHAIRGEAGSEHVRTYRWALTDATWISPSAIAAARASMTELRFRAEYEGVFASGADALFPRHVLDAALCDRVLHPLDGLDGSPGAARLSAGIDWGASVDRTCLVALARVPNTSTFTVLTARRWLQGAQFDPILKEIANAPALWALLCMEGNGLGAPLCQQLIRLLRERRPELGGGTERRFALIDGSTPDRPAPTKYKTPSRARPMQFVAQKLIHHRSAASKAAAYSALRLLVDKGQLLIPRSAEDLQREMLMLRINLSPSGNERIAAATGHDDLCDALTLALIPHRLAEGEWVTRIAQLAERKPIRSLVPVNERDPSAYQSIAGPEISGLSLPPAHALRLR
jgi:hypothetical protein